MVFYLFVCLFYFAQVQLNTSYKMFHSSSSRRIYAPGSCNILRRAILEPLSQQGLTTSKYLGHGSLRRAQVEHVSKSNYTPHLSEVMQQPEGPVLVWSFI